MSLNKGLIQALRFGHGDRILPAIATVSALLCPGAGHAEAVLGGTVGVSARYANNPFLVTGSDTDAASVSVTLALAPTLTTQTARGSVTVAGAIDFSKYTRLYGTEDSYRASVSAQERLSPKLALRGQASFLSSVQGRNFVDGPVIVEEGQFIPLPGDDVTLDGTRQRRNTFSAGAGLDWMPSARQTITADTATALTRYPNGTLAQDYDYVVGKLGYLQKISPSLSAGVSGDIARTNYLRTALGDATIYSPQVNLVVRIDSLWQASIGAGASFARLRELNGSRTTTSLSGSLNICRNGVRARFCGYASRAVLPSAFGAVRPLTTVGATYSYQLSPRDTVDAYASYSRYSGGGGGALLASTGTLRSGATYSRRLNERLRATLAGGYSDTFRDSFAREPNPFVSVGLVFDLAGLR